MFRAPREDVAVPAVPAERQGDDSSTSDDRIAALIRRVFSVGAAGMIAGAVVGGLGGRIAMRISAIAADDRFQGLTTEAGNRVGEITLGGTIGFIIFGGILSGAAGAVVLVAVERWLPASSVFQGLIAGLFLLATVGFTVIDADNFDFRFLDPPQLNVAMFASLFVLFGLAAMPLADRIENRLGRRGVSAYGLLPMVLLGSLVVIPVYGSLFFDGFCECHDPPIEVGAFFVIASLATVLAWVDLARRDWPVRLPVRLLGWIGVAGAALFGVLRLIDEIQRLV
jgi:hypothetical protein